MADYSRFLVKEYKYWTVSVHQNQNYLGRCVVWCKRENALDLADVTKDEQRELFAILIDLRQATKNAFQSDWFNYAFLGNEMRHLHGHFIPRYSSERIFCNTMFVDERWGNNYKTDNNFITPPNVLEAIRLKLQKELTW
jgi:diadenosine tetraphosphate (Ap4A) HIT family hydrolase